MQVIESRPTHDVVVIGSGAAGGMAAYNLTRLGVKVLILDAGAAFDKSDLWTHVLPFEADARIRAGEVPPAFRLDTNEQPYLTPDDKLFDLIRVWGLGGKTNIWGRVSLRMSDLDFGSAELDGWGIPWPIRYADLAPYYDRVDRTRIPFDTVIRNLGKAAVRWPLVIQTLFMRIGGKPPPPSEVSAYAGVLEDIASDGGALRLVQVHTVARPPAEKDVTPLSDTEVDAIADAVRQRLVDVPVETHYAPRPE